LLVGNVALRGRWRSSNGHGRRFRRCRRPKGDRKDSEEEEEPQEDRRRLHLCVVAASVKGALTDYRQREAAGGKPKEGETCGVGTWGILYCEPLIEALEKKGASEGSVTGTCHPYVLFFS